MFPEMGPSGIDIATVVRSSEHRTPERLEIDDKQNSAQPPTLTASLEWPAILFNMLDSLVFHLVLDIYHLA